jgi:RNA polymerase sigma factor (sigma-70 family)
VRGVSLPKRDEVREAAPSSGDDPLVAIRGEDWFARLFREHGHPLRRYLSQLVHSFDAAEDLAQEAFARVYATDAAQIQSPRSFLFRTAHNLALNHVRHQRVASIIPGGLDGIETTDTAPSAEQSVVARQELATLRAAIDRLPPQCRQVFLLRKIEGLSHRQIAERLGIAVSTVEKHIAKGVRSCHAELLATDAKEEPRHA